MGFENGISYLKEEDYNSVEHLKLENKEIDLDSHELQKYFVLQKNKGNFEI